MKKDNIKKYMTKQIKAVKLSEDSLEMLTSGGLTQKQISLINAPTPEQWIKQRVGRGGKQFDYIPVGITIKVLNSCFGFNWSFEIVKEEINEKYKQVVVKGRLTVGLENSNKIIKEQFASKEIQVYSDKPDKNGKTHPKAGEYISIGDDLKGAASLCLTKCASMLGLFSDIYSSDFYAKWEMPDGEDAVEIKVDNNKAFEDILTKIQKLDKEAQKQLAARMLQTPPFELTKEQTETLEALCL